MNVVERVYGVLLYAYPGAFRVRFGPEMRLAFRERASRARIRGLGFFAVFLLRTLSDILGNAAALRLSARERTPMNWHSLWLDARSACRIFARSPLFTLLAILALTLGIGANTAIFTIVNGVLLKPLPYADPDRLVMVWSTNTQEHRDRDPVSPLDFIDYRRARSFSDLQATFSFLTTATLTNPTGAAEQVVGCVVTPGTFEMLGRATILGRAFTAADPPTSMVISHRFWASHMGSDPAVLGRTITLNGQLWTILGVMPDDFVFPYRTMLGPSGFTRSADVDGWLPMQFVDANAPRTAGGANLVRSVRYLSVVGRLKPGVTVEQANSEIAGIARQLAADFADANKVVGARVVPLHEQAVGGTRAAFVLLLGGVGFVLIMACVNLANLILARSSARHREMAIRAALGASRRRLVRQTLVETMLLATVGGALALATVTWTIQILLALAPAEMPRIGEVRADSHVLAFALALSLVTGLGIGLVPALSASRPELQSALKASSRSATLGRGQRRLRAGLVVMEVALAVVLTFGSGLLLRSFLSVLAVDPGFRSDDLLTLQISVPPKYQTADQRRAMYADLFTRLESIPGVIATGGTTRLPLGSTNVSTKIGVEGRDTPIGLWPEVEFRRAVHDYFQAMNIPVIRGRGFKASDGPAAPTVVVINQQMARQVFPNEDPIGRRIRMGSEASPWVTIVGVIGDVRHSGLETPPAPELYSYYLQNPPVNPFIVVRTATDPSSIAPVVRDQVRAVDKDMPAYDIRPMAQVRSDSMAQRRFMLLLVAVFGALALIMAAVGVYGVMALVVTERTPEIGIRLALGAQPSQVVRAVVLQGVLLAGAGVALGLVASAVTMPIVSTQLYGIRPLDLPTVTAVPLLLLAVAALACFVPAYAVKRIDPVRALRE